MFQDMCREPRIGRTIMTGKMSSQGSIVIMFDIKHMNLDLVYDSFPGLTYILDIAIIALQVINQIIALIIPKYHLIEIVL